MAEKRAQRRLAAILMADMVGFSRLMHADETGTRTRFKVVQQGITFAEPLFHPTG